MANEDDILLRVEGLKKSYGDHQVLRDVTFDIQRGKTTVIIGASGSGKTVLMRQIVRLERPDAGRILVDGQDVARLGEVDLLPIRRKFGMVFQLSALFDSMTVFDNVAFLLGEHTRMVAKEIRERVMDRLRALGVEHAVDKMPAELSGGMKKRVAVARALALEPEILIYDEPTTGLDPLTARSVDELINQTRERFGVTSIVISHDLASVFAIGDEVKYLHKGTIADSGTPTEIAQSSHPATREFFAASGVATPQ